MGACAVDTNKNERNYESKYEITTKEGVQQLLEDIPRLQERRYIQGDYDASNILMDLEKVFYLLESNDTSYKPLTEKQKTAIDLVFLKGYTYEEASEKLQVVPSTVFQHCEYACEKIAKVFQNWDYLGGKENE